MLLMDFCCRFGHLRSGLSLSQTLDEYLVVVQKRSSLLVGWYDALVSSEVKLLTKDTWNGDDQSSKKEYSHDNESKDPLEGNGSGKELANSESSCQDAKCEAHGIVLEDDEEEEAIDQDTPDCDIGKDAGCQVMGIHGNGAIPVQSNKCPRQWPRDHWDVDESWVCVVSEVQGGQVEEVDDQNDLGPDEVSSDEEHDESELQHIVEYEVAANPRCCIDPVDISREKVRNISDLEDEQGNPVDGGNDNVQSERGFIDSVYIPDGMAPLFDVVLRDIPRIVEGSDNQQQPGEDCQDPVGPD